MGDSNEQRPLRSPVSIQQTGDSGASSSNRIGATDRPLQPKPAKGTHPCGTCRKRKVKCSGVQPTCHECRIRGLECTYVDPDTNKALKRKLAEAQERLTEHEELYTMLQTRTDQEAGEIVRRIRQGEGAGSVLRFIRDGDLLTELSLAPETWYRSSFPLVKEMPDFLQRLNNPYLGSLLYQGWQTHSNTKHIPYRVPYNVARVADPRLETAQLSKWTSVNDDDALLRDLLHSYFRLQHPMFPFFHKDHFLDDLIAGRHRFCSSLLVNAILAAACQGYRKASNRTEFWNPRTLLIPTVQARLVMSLACNINAEDKIGWSYLVQTIAMADAMKLFDPPPAPAGKKMRVMWEYTGWAAFCWQSPPIVDAPRNPLPDLSENSKWYPELWIMYPSANAPVRMHLGEHFRAVAEFRVIKNRIASTVWTALNTKSRLTLDETKAFHQDLLQYMHYLNILIYLFEPFVSGDSSSVITTTTTTTTTTLDPNASDRPEAIVTDAKSRLETISRLYYLRHGFECYGPMTTQSHAFVGFMAIKTLAGVREAGDEEKALIAKHVQSQFPVNIVSIAEDSGVRNVGNLVAAYRELGLSDVESEGSST
ncbi:hypothetical protein OQA88_12657 [Cercophora sp. LCS_1]